MQDQPVPAAEGAVTTFVVRHTTIYRYHLPVAFGEHRMMLRPRDNARQRVIEAALQITPGPISLRAFEDAAGNYASVARFDGRATELSFQSFARVEHQTSAEDFEPDERARHWPFSYAAEEAADLSRFAERHYPDPDGRVDEWARRFVRQAERPKTRQLLTALTREIRSGFAYAAREEEGIQSPAQTIKLGHGSCRDFSVLLMEAVRSLGMAARFASGYLHVSGRASHIDGGHTHAWVQVYVPGVGWVDFDPTAGSIGNRNLILVAVARDPKQVAPLYGSFLGFPSDSIGMTVSVDVAIEDAAAVERGSLAGSPAPHDGPGLEGG